MNLPVAIPNAHGDTLMWAQPDTVESAALDQLRNISALPWVEKLRVMPDVHLGKGATVGSVIAMKNAVSPSAVGVDIGCLDRDTEVLTPQGWIKIVDWDNQDILIWDPASDEAHFSTPERYIVKECDLFYHFKNSKGLDQMLSGEHRMAVFTGYKGRGRNFQVMNPVDFDGVASFNGYYSFKASFHKAGGSVERTLDEIRMHVMVQADGRIREYTDYNFVELHLRRQRKIERARELLDATGIQFRESVGKDGSTFISFRAPAWCNKDLTCYWDADMVQLAAIATESLQWDGHEGYRSHYSSTDRSQADLVQYAWAATGDRAGIHSRTDERNESWSEMHTVIPTKNEYVGYSKPEIVKSVDGKKYCFVVETGFFVARRNGHIFTTGNCGMEAVLTSLTVDDLPDNLRPLRDSIEAAVPVGFQSHGGHADILDRDRSLFRRTSDKLHSFRDLRAAGIWDREAKMLSQIGTLGGGNHFIEICTDEQGRVWIMLHSGSRNIGKELAERHIATAKNLEHNLDLPDKDLAVFLSDTAEMDAYMNDLMWAQDYAKLNRQTMISLVKEAVVKHFPDVTYGVHVSCHHNYVAKEQLSDVGEVIVTRKGAISAHDGQLGLIPGSMGTGSYVVEGVGNEQGLYSASHGAGRVMSRTKAKKYFTAKDLETQTLGVECRKDAGVVDEIPGAYKNLDDVIAAQTAGESPLVKVVTRLTTRLCVKG